MTECEPVDAQVTVNHGLEGRSDLELIAAINNGDSAAFEVLYFRYRDWVAALAFRFTRDNDAALDVLQETFLYFLKKCPGFRLTANFKTFLYPAVRNLSIAAQRKAARYQATTGELEHLDDVAAATVGTAATDDLQSVLTCLPEEQREVILLRFVDGFNLREVADAMDIPVGTVKSRLHNALQSLRQDERTRDFFDR